MAPVTRGSQKPSLTDVLPPELVVRCLEFSPFDEVHTDLKRVSLLFRSAARRALTRGRWRPVRRVVERYPRTWGLAVTSVEAFRAAWEIEPKLAFLELADWDRGRPSCGRHHTIYSPRTFFSLKSLRLWLYLKPERRASRHQPALRCRSDLNPFYWSSAVRPLAYNSAKHSPRAARQNESRGVQFGRLIFLRGPGAVRCTPP